MTDYSIVSVDWKPEQTKLWLHHVKKNCPDAEIVLIKDEKPIPWNWASGKINCFKQKFATDRIIYMDTDTIVTRDLGFIFDNMGEATVGATSAIPIHPFNKRRDIIKALKPLGPLPTHFSTGLIALQAKNPPAFASLWQDMYPVIRKHLPGDHYMNEITFSYLVREMNTHDIPLEVHGNICGKKYFGNTEIPAVIHYHKPARLRNFGLDKYIDINSNPVS